MFIIGAIIFNLLLLCLNIPGALTSLAYILSMISKVISAYSKSGRTVLSPGGPLARYAKLRFAHTPGMRDTFSPPPLVSDHATQIRHRNIFMNCHRWSASLGYITIVIDGMCVTSKIITFTLLSSTERVMNRT